VGGKDEEGVAVLPDEKSSGLRERDLARARDTTSRDVEKKEKKEAGVVERVKGDEKTKDAKDSKENVKQGAKETKDQYKEKAKEVKDAAKDTAKEKTGMHKGAENKGSGYNTDYHPAEINPPPPPEKDDKENAPPLSKPTSGVAPPQPSGLGERGSPNVTDTGAGSKDHDHEESDTKPKFMDKMKGGAKVLMGKVGGNAEKVEEGRKLKAGVHN